MAKIRTKITLDVEIDTDVYRLNYGTDGLSRAEAVDYAEDTVRCVVRDQFERVGEWATVVKVTSS